MRSIFTCFAVAAFVINTNAQARLVGVITDPASVPLEGVNLMVGDDPRFGATTGRAGHFAIQGLRPGTVRLRLSFIGYEAVDTLLHLHDGDNRYDHAMRASAVRLREAEVSVLRAGDRAPFARTVVTREEIQRINTGVDLPYLLELQPGVVSTSDGGTGIGYTYIRIRGTDGTRTNITLNGVPFNDPESQGAFLVNLPDLASSAEDIEIQRGVGTSTNGPAAFGASINLRTTAVKRDAWGLVGVSGGSYNTQRYSVSAGTGLLGAGEGSKFSLDMRLASITTDGYVDRASADLKSYFLQGAWIGASRSLRFITFRGKERTYQAWAGVDPSILDTNRTFNPYTYENEVDDYDQTHYQLLFDQRIGSSTNLNITLFRVLGQGYFEQYREADDLSTYRIDPAVINGDTILTTDLIRRRWLDNTLIGANISATIKLGAHRLVLGGNYSDYRGDHFGELIWARYAGDRDIRDRYYDNDARKTDANAFAKLTYAVNELIDVFGDVQVRQVGYRFLGFNNDLENITQQVDHTFFNPKAGLLWRVHEGGRAYASIAVANREPNRNDLEETTPLSRPGSERLLDYELGYERRGGRFSAGVNAYYMDYTDQLVLTGELNDVGAALRTNVPRSYRAGVELMWAVQPVSRLTWRANASFSANKVLDYTEYVDDWDTWEQRAITHGTTDLAFSPSVVAGSELSYRFWRRQRDFADLTFSTKYVGAQYLDNTGSTERMLDPFLVNDLRLNVGLFRVKGIQRIDLNLTVRNIFNEVYESNGWVYSYFAGDQRQELIGLYPQAPLNVLGGFTLRF
ncbi:MAG: TonB-dependent receptor [Flavobacteriales bacterium]|nr:TonB-dependent receptor [Flavobacteriales bacterium]MCB9179393.1 TonB-dependent receptor [Flavobacteriales bacterium]